MESIDSEMDKYETANKGFGEAVHKQNNVNNIKVKQYIPQMRPRREKMTEKRQTEDTTGFAKYEESTGDVASVKDRITIYDETDRFKLRELSQPSLNNLNEKPTHVNSRTSMPFAPSPPKQQAPPTRLNPYNAGGGPPKQIRINGITVQAGGNGIGNGAGGSKVTSVSQPSTSRRMPIQTRSSNAVA